MVVDKDHDHTMPPVAKLLPSTKLQIREMVKDGRQTTGAICNFSDSFTNDPGARQEERVNAHVRKAHQELFGDDLDFGGIRYLTERIIKEDFIRVAVKDMANPSETLCFLQTDFQKRILATCDYLFADISYKLCRNYYKMVLTGFDHVTHKGAVVATGYLEKANEVSYATFFKALFKHNSDMLKVTARDITFSFDAIAVDFSDAQRKGLVTAVYTVALERGCQLSRVDVEKRVLLQLKGCEFHFEQSLTKVARSGALSANPMKSVFKAHVSAWTQSRNMQSFSSNKAQLLQYFPSVKGWINWWSLPVHAVLLFPGVRQDMLGETDEMYGHLPSTNNTAEASNSMESRFCRHNVELVPSIHDSYRITLRQQKQHEGILSGATSPTHFNRNRKFFLLTLSQAK